MESVMAKKKASATDEVSGVSFEESLESLERIVADLEGGDLGLSEALARYEDGVKHLRSCQQLLERAERRIELLSGVDADGKPITEPFDDAAPASLDEQRAKLSQRRSAAAKPSQARQATQSDDVDDVHRLF